MTADPKFFADDPKHLPDGSVIDGAHANENLSDIADYVIVGSGAAGSTAAFTLSDAGYSVILIEEGPWVRTKEFGVDVYPALKKMFRASGTNFVVGRSLMTVLQGRCVGGGTTVNSAIALRAPDFVISDWTKSYDIRNKITSEDLENHFDFLDRELMVHAVRPEALGANNSVFGEAAKKIGVQAKPIQRYDSGCNASANCLTGCRNGKKMSMGISFIPRSLKRGARIYTSARVRKVSEKYGRATSVEGHFLSPERAKFKIHARRGIILAASAVQTPGILHKSGVKLPALGNHFMCHTGTTLAAKFDRDISMNIGATQGFNSLHFVNQDRFKIETLSLPPEMLSIRVPGAGKTLTTKLAEYPHILNAAVVVRGQTEGRVRSALGREWVLYSPSKHDVSRIRAGYKKLAEMYFAAGAKEVWPTLHGMSPLKSPDELHRFDTASVDPRAYSLMMSHLFGGCRMGTRPTNSVVGLDFQVHGARGLYVLDSSIFPSNIGVNPQHTIMAIARKGALEIAERPLPLASH